MSHNSSFNLHTSEEGAEHANDLPLSFKTSKEQEYIEFLWDAFETNFTQSTSR